MTDDLPGCLTRHGERLRLDVSVVPNAKRSGADGLHDGALRVRLAAPPVDGKANDALLGWLVDALCLKRRDLVLVRGQTARRKLIEIDAPASQVIEALQRLLADSTPPR